jgi:hypothetical protein
VPRVSNIQDATMRLARFAAIGLFAISTLAVKAQAQGLPPLAKTLKPNETALILVDFQYPFVNSAGGNYRAVKDELEKKADARPHRRAG